MAVAQSAKTHCPQGHPYDEANTLLSKGRRHCRQCMKDRYRANHPPKTKLSDKALVLALSRVEPSGCWFWEGSTHAAGYGCYGARLAHRLSYEAFIGPIPDGLTLDHLCRNRRCVNPRHLEPVTIAENVLRGESLPARNARKTHCPKGHPYDESNTYISPRTGWRQCRACQRGG